MAPVLSNRCFRRAPLQGASRPPGTGPSPGYPSVPLVTSSKASLKNKPTASGCACQLPVGAPMLWPFFCGEGRCSTQGDGPALSVCPVRCVHRCVGTAAVSAPPPLTTPNPGPRASGCARPSLSSQQAWSWLHPRPLGLRWWEEGDSAAKAAFRQGPQGRGPQVVWPRAAASPGVTGRRGGIGLCLPLGQPLPQLVNLPPVPAEGLTLPLDSWISPDPSPILGPRPWDPRDGTGGTSSNPPAGGDQLKLTSEKQLSEPKQAAKSYAFPSKLKPLI